MDDRDIETIVFEALGEASTCWIPSTGDAEFDSGHAQRIGDRLLTEIRARIIGDRTDEVLAELEVTRGQRDGYKHLLDSLADKVAAEAFHPNALLAGDGAPIIHVATVLELLGAIHG